MSQLSSSIQTLTIPPINPAFLCITHTSCLAHFLNPVYYRPFLLTWSLARWTACDQDPSGRFLDRTTSCLARVEQEITGLRDTTQKVNIIHRLTLASSSGYSGSCQHLILPSRAVISFLEFHNIFRGNEISDQGFTLIMRNI